MKNTRFFLCAILASACLPLATYATSVNASAFGFSPEDATECLQKAIDSGAATVVVDNTGADWLVRPITLRSNLELVLGENVTLRAKPGEFKGRTDCLLNCWDLDNVTIRGTKNSRLSMPKKDYQNPALYQQGEWRHDIRCFGCSNFILKDLTIDGSGGDGMDVNRGRKRSKSTNVLVENVTFVNHHRLAMGASSVENFIARNCRFLNTSGTAPQGGIDFEPNKPDESIINVRFQDCLFAGNAYAGVDFVLTPLNETSPASSVYLERCIVENNASGLAWTECPFRPSTLVMRDCIFRNNRHEAFRFANLQKGMFQASLEGCVIQTDSATHSPITFTTNLLYENPFGDIDFGDLKITDSHQRPAIAPQVPSSGLSDNITASNMTVTHNGVTCPVDLAALVKANPPPPHELRIFKAANFFPADYTLAPGQKGKTTPPLTLRGASHIVQWLPANTPVEIRMKLVRETKSYLDARVEVLDANNGIADRFTITGEEEKVYRFAPQPHATMRQFKIRPGSHAVHYFSTTPGQGIVANSGMHICEMDAELYFIVPKDATEVKIAVTGEEPLCAALFNAKGEKVMDYDKRFTGMKILMGKRQPSQQDELWKVKAYNTVEDYYLRIGAPCCPVFFTAPENALARKAR